MSEEQNQVASESTSELELLKTTARDLGVKFHPSIGLDALKDKVQEFLDAGGAGDSEDDGEAVTAPPTPEQVKADALKLIRVRVVCMNPSKSAYEGELFCAGNRYTGMVKKYVPFGVDWHVPQIILDMIRERKCQVFSKKRVRTSSGVMVEQTEGKLVREFAVEVLPPLTPAEIKDLAQRQAMARGTSDGQDG